MSADTIHGLLHHYGYLFVFLLLLTEAIGLPVPGETVMVAAALYAASTHRLGLAPLLAAAFAGTVAGGMIGYVLGRRFGAPLLLRYGRHVGMHADRRLLGRYLMQRNGAALVFLGRFVALLRCVTAVPCGRQPDGVAPLFVIQRAGRRGLDRAVLRGRLYGRARDHERGRERGHHHWCGGGGRADCGMGVPAA